MLSLVVSQSQVTRQLGMRLLVVQLPLAVLMCSMGALPLAARPLAARPRAARPLAARLLAALVRSMALALAMGPLAMRSHSRSLVATLLHHYRRWNPPLGVLPVGAYADRLTSGMVASFAAVVVPPACHREEACCDAI